MTAADCIALLDAALDQYGETVTLKRLATTATVLASVRGIKAEELIGTATTSNLMVIVSPTGLSGYGLPKANDKVHVKGIDRQVKFADPIYVSDVWVRTNLVVAG
jgi:hypothetical protein